MSRRLFVVAAAVIAVTVAFAAPVAAVKTVPVADWTESVCKGFSRWEAQLAKLGSIGRLADPSAGKAAISTYLTGAALATDTLAKAVRSAGVPSVKHGKEIAAGFTDSVESLRAAYATARTTAATLPTTDPATFAGAARALATQLQSAGTTLDSTLSTTARRYPTSVFLKAFRSTKACQTLK